MSSATRNLERNRFPTTHWTLVQRLRSGDVKVARRALDELIAQYRYTLYAYIRRRGLSHCDAEDALHDFLLKLLNARSFMVADESRGRLRGYLGTSLANFLNNWHRSESRRMALAQEIPAHSLEGNEAQYAREHFLESDTPERIFDRKWGRALMDRVMSRLKAKCLADDKVPIFTALRPVLLAGGSLRGHDAPVLAARLGMSEVRLRVTLNRHLRDYRQMLEEEVAQTVENPSDIADEIACLRAIFSPPPATEDARRGCSAGDGIL